MKDKGTCFAQHGEAQRHEFELRSSSFRRAAGSLLLPLFFLLFLAVPLAATVVPDQSTLTLRTPALADVSILKVRLDNGLEAYLISDPEAEEAGAALSVEVGTWQDPREFPGQAHFTEHLLFLGNASYPEENGFRRFLDAHGGKSNAYTAPQITNFMFEVQPGALPEALAQFGAFFVEPDFNQDAMGREVQAVDQEFARATANDFWRKELVLRHLNNSRHPDSGFGMGNVLTLGDLTSEQARTWFEAHYSAGLMHLVVYGPQPLSELQELVTANFSAIPNRDLARFEVPGKRRSPATLGKIVAIRPHSEMRELTLTWELPYDYRGDIEGHTSTLIAFILGHEGKGSLLSTLREEGLAEGVGAGTSPLRRDDTVTMLFNVSISLTPKGVKERDLVVERAFEAIAQLQEEGVPPYIFDEIKTMNRLGYEFQTRTDPFDLVSGHARALVGEPLATYPERTVLPHRFDPEDANTIAAQLTPGSLYLTLVAPPSESGLQPKDQEPYMEVDYVVAPVAVETMSRWEAAGARPSFALPSPNPFIPESVGVSYQGRPHSELGTPLLLQDSAYGKAYYLQDKNFLAPKIAHRTLIKSGAITPGNPRTGALLDLWVRAMDEALTETSYQAYLAGLSYGLEAKEEGIMLTLLGYSEKADLLLEEIAQTIRESRPTAEEFARYKESLASDYRNGERETPIEQAIALTKSVLIKNYIPRKARLEALEELTYGSLLLFSDRLLEETYLESALFGNLTRKGAEQLLAKLQTSLQQAPYPAGARLTPEVASLPNTKGPHLIAKRIRMEGNAAILAIEQGPFSLQRQAAQQLLAAGIEEPFFTQLRTQQQTGYVVWSWDQEIERHLFNFFAVQSNNVDGRDLVARYEQMIDGFLRDMATVHLPEKRFDQLKSSLATKIAQPPKNPCAMSELLFQLAFKYDGEFDWREKRIAAIEALSYDEFQQLTAEFLGRGNKARLAVLIEGTMPPAHSLRYRQARSTDRVRRLSRYQNRHQIVAARPSASEANGEAA